MNFFKKAAMVILTTAVVGGGTVIGLSNNSNTVIPDNEGRNIAAFSQKNNFDKTREDYINENTAVSEKSVEASADAKKTPQTSEKEKNSETISFAVSSVSLGLGESYKLKTNIKAVKLSSDNNKIIEIKDGTLKAVSLGSADVTAFDENGKSDSCKITVKESPDYVSLEMDKYDITLGVGETYKLSAVIPEGTAAAGRKFSSSDSDILKVTKSDWQGEFKALKPGVAYATVKLYNGREASCEITVKEAPDKITISRPELVLGVGETFRLSAGIPSGTGSASRVFRSSDSNIIKMTKTNWTGEFKAVKTGTAWVTVRSYNGKESSCKIIVKKAPESVSLSKTSVELTVGQKYTLTCSVNDGAAASMRTFRSSNNSIIEMTKTEWAGAFTAVGEGTAWITVRTYNGKEKSCKVTVKAKKSESAPESGRVTDNSGNQSGNNTGGGHVTAPDGTPWSSDSDNTVIYTDENMITLTNNVAVLDIGDSYTAEISDSSSGSVTYSSGDTSVAVVNGSGSISAVGAGNTNIYIKDGNGNTAKLTVIVLGNRYSCIYPEIYSVYDALDSAKLSPLKTNYQPIDNMVDEIFAEIFYDGMSNAEKVQACYDYLAQNCTYGYDGYKAVNIDGYYSDEDKEIAEFSYCILKDQLGTCENFSAAFVVMMRRLGYEANQVYGQVAMAAGGYDGHYWADVEIGGKHYLFDPQVERNCLGENNTVYHYFFGMDPEDNYNMYRYEYMTCVHGFRGR